MGMRWRWWLAAMLAGVVGTAGGCIFSQQPSERGSNSGEATADAGADAGGDDDSGNDSTGGCEEKAWYPDDDGDEFGDADAEDDPTMACEQPEGMVDNAEDCDDSNPDVHPDAEEICNGRDDNCDGSEDVEAEVSARDCELQAGVCEGASVSSCDETGEAYMTCGVDQYGEGYVESDDEGWRCDGADNDCDGEVDEACCEDGASPESVQVGGDSADQTRPVLVPAVEGAPEDALFLAVWAEGETIVLEHIDEVGETTGEGESLELDEVTSLDAVRTESGYAVAATATSTANVAVLRRYNAALELQGSSEEGFDSSTGQIDNVSVEFHDQTIWAVYSSWNRELTNLPEGGYTIRATAIDAESSGVAYGPFDVSPSGQGLPQPGDPEIAVVDGTPTVGWWDAPSETIRGARLSEDTVDSRFRFPMSLVNSVQAEPIELFAHDATTHILHADYTDSGDSSLDHVAIDPGETGELEGGEAITGDADLHRQPTALPVEDEAMLVVWARGDSSDPTLLAARSPLDSSDRLSGSPVKRGGDESERPHLAATGPKAGVAWLETVMGNDRDVKYAPLSIDGVPVCASD